MPPVASMPSLIFALILLALVISSLVTTLHASSSLAATPAPVPAPDSNGAEFQALLCLKLHLARSPGLLPASWKNDDSLGKSLCSWSGVTCSRRHASRRAVAVVALDLDSLGLDGQIPPCISNLTSLARISLANNQLGGQIPPELGRLNMLRYLNLSGNTLSGVIPSTLSCSPRLQSIDLSTNGLTGRIPISLGTVSPLRYVVLSNNTLTGPIPPLLAKSSSLQALSLMTNRLSGEIPPELFNSTSLEQLFLAENNFTGSIPASYPSPGSPLKYLILQSNSLSGVIPSTLGNFSSLQFLYLGGNNFQGSIPMSIHKILNLQVLDFSYNNLSGVVPASVYNMSSLTYLGMATNSLVGEIPYDIGYTLPRIQSLIMQDNQFQGQIPTSLANATSLEEINLRNNTFHGIVPSFGTLPNLIDLNLGNNQLEAGDWSFFTSLKNCTQLVKIQLDANNLQGDFPSSFADLSNTIETVLLRSNNISGTIPQEIEHLTNLTVLYMDHNLLSGNLPDSLGNLSKLFVLSLSQNKLSGQIPPSLGNLSQLSELYLQENNFSGQIPGALGGCKKLDILNLSCNSFDGSIPKELFTLSSLSEGLDLSHNQLSGEIPVEIGILINLGPLSMSNNMLSGEIPSTLGRCIRLESLHMEVNLLHGRIPDTLRNLRGINVMDLSQNNLSGEVPEFLESFSFMNLLNLSFNNLEGPVPIGGIFQNRSEVFIQGNNKLCASTPLLELPFCNAEKSKISHTSSILKIVGFTSLSLVLLSCCVIILVKKRNKFKQAAHPSCRELKRFTYDDLVKATNGFSLGNLVGSGKYGSVYKGKFESEEDALAIKVFKLDQLGATKSFVAECEALRNTRHRNLVRVITACSTFDPTGHEFKALVLEYMVNGNLESWLHSTFQEHRPRKPLSLGARIIIAVDIAAALDYLHNHCIPPVAHCDMKPSNVLLDDLMGARVSDFGLAKLLQKHTSSGVVDISTSLLGPRGSIGYIAPEYGFGRKISTDGDVYSYGIIILEILTGKRPTDEMFKDGLNLHKSVEKAFPRKVGGIIDPSIVLDYGDEGEESCINLDQQNSPMDSRTCIMKLLELGLACSAEAPKDRPTMQDVYSYVVAIKEEFSAQLYARMFANDLVT